MTAKITAFAALALTAACAARPLAPMTASKTPVPSSSSTKSQRLQPLPADGSSLYYYVDGARMALTPSLEWISIEFAVIDQSVRAAALQDSIVDPYAESQELFVPGWMLLPVRKGLTTEALLDGINALRADRSILVQVNPVFGDADGQMIVTDQFIARFPVTQVMEDIDTLNLSRGVQTVEPLLGQENTFVLRVTAHSELDALAMANAYQEDGLALHSAPNFVRMLKR
jgi:hypothetical protein